MPDEDDTARVVRRPRPYSALGTKRLIRRPYKPGIEPAVQVIRKPPHLSRSNRPQRDRFGNPIDKPPAA